jgi:Fic family protein
MEWNWQLDDWPNFRYQLDRLEPKESQFLLTGGTLIGATKHLQRLDGQELQAEVLTDEAMTTSAIEGEVLERRSVRSSIRRHLGLEPGTANVGPRERAIADMTINALETWDLALSHESLGVWHRLLCGHSADLQDVGRYRTHAEPMQIVSGAIGREVVHFEAPPSERVHAEMSEFIEWFNGSRGVVGAVARSAIAHLYFESIHPFEDGNGRIGRAISDKALAQGLGQPGLTMLAAEIEHRKKEYYSRLDRASTSNDVTEWTDWFSDVVLAAQSRAQRWIEFVIAKAKLLDAIGDRINARQEKALLRMFQEGPSGFAGGLSAGNYQRITGSTPATANRDLAELVKLGALSRTGERRGTRYWLTV